jgi:capsular polysaccharide transport system permease protein
MRSATAIIEAYRVGQMERIKAAGNQAKVRPFETIQLVPVDPAGSMVDVPYREEAAQPRRWSARARLFFGIVVVPTFLVAVYLFLIAAPRYLSEASFIVRSAATQGPQGSFGSGAAMSAASLSSAGAPGDFADAVNTYILSRDMVEQLEKGDALRSVLSRQESDFLFRFPNFYRRDDREQLYYHYLHMVTADLDTTSGISTVSVTTFRPEDSQKLLNALLQHAEELINRLNDRMMNDAESYAQSVVKRAQDQVVDVGLRLVEFRNSVGSVDPSRESATALDQIAQMTTGLAEMQASLQQQIALSPSSAAIPALRERIRTYQEQIEQEKLKIVGADRSLAAKLSEFEKLTLERQLAAREMESALAGLTAARQDAQRQHLYLQRITEPNLADEARFPRRVLGLTLAFALFLAIFVLVNSIYKGIIEHRV